MGYMVFRAVWHSFGEDIVTHTPAELRKIVEDWSVDPNKFRDDVVALLDEVERYRSGLKEVKANIERVKTAIGFEVLNRSYGEPEYRCLCRALKQLDDLMGEKGGN